MFAAYENEDFRKGLIANGVIGAIQGHELLSELLTDIHDEERYEKYNNIPWIHTGPVFFTKIYNKKKR